MMEDDTEPDTCTCHPRLPLTPPDGWTLDNLPLADLPSSAELIRGALIMSPPTAWHQQIVGTLTELVDAQSPDGYRVQYRMAVKRSARTAPEPDFSVIHAAAFDLGRYYCLPKDVVLAAEVVTPESEERDREDKPRLYAGMGIPAFWLIERGADAAPVVYEYRLRDGDYHLEQTHSGRLRTGRPFSIDVPLASPGSAEG
ncbi:MAG TPA: Uma2 family endonuclease [Actinospica sp.]|nr:Uma2 family endonuclease [Actinospica sp.]